MIIVKKLLINLGVGYGNISCNHINTNPPYITIIITETWCKTLKSLNLLSLPAEIKSVI